MPEYVVSVGMEVHAELLTRTKMFCRCPVEFGGMPNTRVCPVCIGLPGTLPVPNHAAVQMVLRTALALNCKVPQKSVFHRKNYFYPDLPKGYQVSQYEETNPIGYHGWLEIPTPEGGTKRIKIKRVHLEEDTGKLTHLPGGGSGVDYNRAGVPLMEIVTDFPPDIESPEDAKEYLAQLRQILIYLGVCDGKLEQGSMRCEPNISVRPQGSHKYGTKSELKNLNSFRSVQLGVKYEHERQSAVVEAGGTLVQETRGWNEQKLESFVMRVKESEQDYRYFPDPDLVPLTFTEEEIETARAALPELPLARHLRFMQDFGLSNYDAGVLINEKSRADFFDECVRIGGSPKPICNWMTGDFARLLNEHNQAALITGNEEDGKAASKIRPAHLVQLVELVENSTISGKIAKNVFEAIFESGEMPAAYVEANGLQVVSDTGAIAKVVEEVLAENMAQVQSYREGKVSLLGFFVGQVMKKSGGKADPPTVQTELKKRLDE